MSITVYCHRPDRLGARLKNFLYAIRFSKSINASLVVNWSPTAVGLSLDADKRRSIDHDAYCFYDLFDKTKLGLAFPEISVTRLDNIEMRNLCRQMKAVPISEKPDLESSCFQNEVNYPIFYDSTNPRLLDNVHEESVEYYFKLLPLHFTVNEALADVTRQLELPQALCLHVRRGDLMSVSEIGHALKIDPDNNQLRLSLLNAANHFLRRYAPYEAYRTAINHSGDGTRLIVMSDDEEIKRQFARDYGERCFDYKSILDQHHLTPQQRDFVEFLLIAKSGTIIGTESAFVDFPATLGGKKVINVLAFIDVQHFIDDLKSIFVISSSDPGLFDEILDLYMKFFSTRHQLVDQKKQLMSYLHQLY